MVSASMMSTSYAAGPLYVVVFLLWMGTKRRRRRREDGGEEGGGRGEEGQGTKVSEGRGQHQVLKLVFRCFHSSLLLVVKQFLYNQELLDDKEK